MLLIKHKLVTVQQYILLHPHDMPCVTTIANVEEVLIQWAMPMRRHVSKAVSSTHCKPQKCNMLKEPLPMSPFRAERLPP